MSSECIEESPPIPMLIQGGLGVGVSDYGLARATALAGEKLDKPVLGTVSATGVEVLMARRLQDGDPGGYMRIALAAFPNQEIADRILDKYYFAEKPKNHRYIQAPKLKEIINPKKKQELVELSAAANFAEAYLAAHREIDPEVADKWWNGWVERRNNHNLNEPRVIREAEEILEKHNMPIAANGLEDIQALHGPRLYGQMLAGVNFVIEGAGNPHQVPHILDLLVENKAVTYKVDLEGSNGETLDIDFDPKWILPEGYSPRLTRPRFLAIVSSNLLATYYAKKLEGVDGIIVEGKGAGGHSQNPRKDPDNPTAPMQLDENGEPVFRKKDRVNLRKIVSLGIPVWFAGSWGSPKKFAAAIEKLGAVGAQTGTQWAFCKESGMEPKLKKKVRRLAYLRKLKVFTKPFRSPTKYLFKIADVEGTHAKPEIYRARKRKCDLGHLIKFRRDENGNIVTGCPAAPGGEGNWICLCNALARTAGYGEVDKFGEEKPIVTSGKDTSFLPEIMEDEDDDYTAERVVKRMFRDITPEMLEAHRQKKWRENKIAA